MRIATLATVADESRTALFTGLGHALAPMLGRSSQRCRWLFSV